VSGTKQSLIAQLGYPDQNEAGSVAAWTDAMYLGTSRRKWDNVFVVLMLRPSILLS
jgi:hypothetical protein